MAEGKWISGLTAETEVADAGRCVLETRLHVVRHNLALAVRKGGQDLENVHQLRVGTRRAGAALDIFQSCLPDKVARRSRRRLRRLRRAAGGARDWDVFILALLERKRRSRESRPGNDLLLGYAVGQRTAAQAHLEDVGQDSLDDFDDFVARLLDSVREPDGPGPRTLLDLGRPMLADLLSELNAAAQRDPSDFDNLHQARIAGKRLRYAMEVFVDCFAASFRDRFYPAVEEMQDILGQANDSHVASQRLVELRDHLRTTRPAEWEQYRKDVDGLLRYHRQRLPRERRRFLEWWAQWQQSGNGAALAALVQSSPQTAVLSS
jgi:CHAD domain-containing protein